MLNGQLCGAKNLLFGFCVSTENSQKGIKGGKKKVFRAGMKRHGNVIFPDIKKLLALAAKFPFPPGKWPESI